MWNPIQKKVGEWLIQCFGEEIASDKLERNDRYIEESLELVQSCGYTRDRAHDLVDYVFDRPVGEKHQEVGGSIITLAALCVAQDINMQAAGYEELARITQPEVMKKIQIKQATKPRNSPLPQMPVIN